MVERWHRTLKAAIVCKDTTRWSEHLPLILLGLRTTFKSDIQASPAELVYGTTLRIPAEFLVEESRSAAADQSDFARTLREGMSHIRPPNTSWHADNPTFIHADLSKCSHVFIRNDTVRPALTTPYHGPYPVINRKSKSFQVRLNDRPSWVSVDRLKPAYIANDSSSTPQPTNFQRDSSPLPMLQQKTTSNAAATPATEQKTPTVVTRSQRKVIIPARYR
ncbi:uncharacterized protein LOC131292816 [Anopheles ziemanni]|uniref:uncharacterized protein LOC131271165 n=1 Tax=Anopheles coustani TaxID=139045 RepID=UPI00265B4AAF|nr:uncharacterized protein LOC131271165 [Anopheles coustani]XP_058176883.1 uncharacterized protein LOC131292816 [Anopheles ziemanni]